VLLSALREASAAVIGELVISTSPNSEVYLDGALQGRADAQGGLTLKSKLGPHALKVTLSGKKDFEQSVTLVAQQTTSIQARLLDVGPPPGTARENPKDGLKYVWIPPGTFMMGCSPGDDLCGTDEKPVHQVTITKGFWLGQTEVPVGAYKRFVTATGRQMPPEPTSGGRALNPGWGGAAMPIVDVTWDEAASYCTWAGGRLPTEAEWEYAARAGSTAARYGDLDEIAWYTDNSGRARLDGMKLAKENAANSYMARQDENGNNMHDVGLKSPNAFGLYDILGNVWEFVNDWYEKYQPNPVQDPMGPASGTYRDRRGGMWSGYVYYVRASFRAVEEPSGRENDDGMRCAKDSDLP